MSSDPDTTRVVRSWMDEGVTQLPDRVLDAVLDQIPATPQRRATWWPAGRLPAMNSTLKFGLAAVVLAVAALIGISYLGGTSNLGGPPAQSSSPSAPPPTPTASASVMPSSAALGNLAVGETFSLSIPAYPVDINITIPATGWNGIAGSGYVTKGGGDPPAGAGVIAYFDPSYIIYGDPCAWLATRPETPATTVDEVVAALSSQALRDASVPEAVTVGSYTGQVLTLHVPSDADFSECDHGQFASWGVPGEEPARWHQGPGQIDKLWIIDVDGRVAILDASYYEATPQSDIDELDAMVESASFD